MRKILKTVFSVIVAVLVFFGSLFLLSDLGVELPDVIERIIPVSNAKVDIDFEEEFGTKTMYYYNQLSESEKNDYLRLYLAIKNFQETCELNIKSKSLGKIYVAVKYDNPELFWIGYEYSCSARSNGISVNLEYAVDENEALETKKQLDKKVAEITAEALKYSTEYEKEKYFHDYICKNVVYDEATFGVNGGLVSQTLLNGSAICEGYAKSMQLLLNAVGIDNYLVIGVGVPEGGPAEDHVWNIVEIDGNNYHLDVTWDDLEQDDSLGYMYFNITDADISGDHKDIQPAENNCVSYEANYFYMNGTFLQSFDGYDDLVIPTAEMLKSGNLHVEFRFVNSDDYENALATINNDNTAFFTYVGDSVTKSGKKLSKDSINYFFIDSINYLCIVFLDR